MLILWGGTDINPQIYEQILLPQTDFPDVKRDVHEIAQVNNAIFKGEPIIGVCRGAQLLCALNDGSLYQHSIGHNKSHSLWVNNVENYSDEFEIENVAADHHQIMRPKGDYIIWAYSEHDTEVWDENGERSVINFVPEVVWWPETKCLAIQPHPEWMTKEHPFNIWLDKLIFDLTGERNVFFKYSEGVDGQSN